MEVIKNLLEMFCLFSLVESFILSLFVNKIGRMRFLKWYELILFGVMFSTFTMFIPPLLRQALMIILIVGYMTIKGFGKLSHITKIILLEFAYTLVIEALYAMCLEFSGIVDIVLLTNLDKFITMLPMRIIEILLIMLGGKIMGTQWFGEIKEPEEKTEVVKEK